MVNTNNRFPCRRRSGFRSSCLIPLSIYLRKEARIEVLHRIGIEKRRWNNLARERQTTVSREARSRKFGGKSRIRYLRHGRNINDLACCIGRGHVLQICTRCGTVCIGHRRVGSRSARLNNPTPLLVKEEEGFLPRGVEHMGNKQRSANVRAKNVLP